MDTSNTRRRGEKAPTLRDLCDEARRLYPSPPKPRRRRRKVRDGNDDPGEGRAKRHSEWRPGVSPMWGNNDD